MSVDRLRPRLPLWLSVWRGAYMRNWRNVCFADLGNDLAHFERAFEYATFATILEPGLKRAAGEM